MHAIPAYRPALMSAAIAVQCWTLTWVASLLKERSEYKIRGKGVARVYTCVAGPAPPPPVLLSLSLSLSQTCTRTHAFSLRFPAADGVRDVGGRQSCSGAMPVAPTTPPVSWSRFLLHSPSSASPSRCRHQRTLRKSLRRARTRCRA